MCSDEQHQELIAQLKKLAPAPKEPYFLTVLISDSQGWQMDYRGYRHVYMWLPQALTLNLGEWGTGPVQAQVWISLGIKTGIRIMTSGTTNPVPVILKFSDEVVV